jgi:hypothetical protein
VTDYYWECSRCGSRATTSFEWTRVGCFCGALMEQVDLVTQLGGYYLRIVPEELG